MVGYVALFLANAITYLAYVLVLVALLPAGADFESQITVTTLPRPTSDQRR